MRRVLVEGAAWEVSTSSIISALVKKRKYKQKRIGSRPAKEAERLLNPSGVLVGEDATSFRALAARANYLALDRPDIAFAAKELCKSFANPTRLSVNMLKRLEEKLAKKKSLPPEIQ